MLIIELVPDWALYCTENPDLTVQYISDSGAVQLTRNCNETIKEISCQSKGNKIDMYNALKCPEEKEEIKATIASISASTTGEPEPKVIIKNPQKMMEDIFDSLDIDTNRLEETNVQHKVDLDLMMGDQPVASDDEKVGKKVLPKQTDKKEVFPKKTKQKFEKLKVKSEDEQMMGDEPAEEIHSTTEQSTNIPTTDRQRRDVNLVEATTTITDVITESTESSTESEGSSSTELPSSSTTEQILTTFVTEETTTKVYVQGHPLHMSQAIFKEPISPDGTHERIEIGKSEDRFIPPMLLVKAKTPAPTTTEDNLLKETQTTDISESTEQTIVDVTDIADESSTINAITTQKSEISNDISLNNNNNETTQITEAASIQLENMITTVIASEKPIMIEKRNDPRLGLKAVTTSAPSSTTSQTTPQIASVVSSTIASDVTTMSDELTSNTETGSTESTFEMNSGGSSSISISTDESHETELLESSSSSPSLSYSSQPTFVSDTSKPQETLVTSSTFEQEMAEKVILSTAPAVAIEQTVESSAPIISTSTEKIPQTTITKSAALMRNDIDAYHQTDEVSRENEEEESSEYHHLENTFSNADNYQPYKPNRHRSIVKPEHHHGPGFTIGKILG